GPHRRAPAFVRGPDFCPAGRVQTHLTPDQRELVRWVSTHPTSRDLRGPSSQTGHNRPQSKRKTESMALKSYKPTTPGQRGLVLIDRSELWKGRPVKALTEGLSKHGGRNNTGRITMRRKGGGAKRLYRIVAFKRSKSDVAANVLRIEYDPNRTAFIALIQYPDGEQAYILAPQRLAIGDKVIAGAKVDIKPGNAMPFSGMP